MGSSLRIIGLGTALLAASPLLAFTLDPGRQAYEQGDYDLARDIFSRQLSKSPDDADAAYGLGNSLYRLGRYPEASDAYQRALENEPGLEQGWFNLGNSLFKQGRYQEAAGAYEQALKLDPKDGAALHNLELARKRSPPPPPASGSSGQNAPPKDGGKKGAAEGGIAEKGRPGPPGKGSARPQADMAHTKADMAHTKADMARAQGDAVRAQADQARREAAQKELGLNDKQVEALLEQMQRRERQSQDYFTLDPKKDAQSGQPWDLMSKEQAQAMKRLFGSAFQGGKNQPEEDW